jgi:hypothetical protein
MRKDDERQPELINGAQRILHLERIPKIVRNYRFKTHWV